ncbi:MAG: MFS transporter [Alphaproteobacteria bacterium]|nr:MFS transporter [Alphaproteobacteria bacterium]
MVADTQSRSRRRAFLGATIGHVIEWYDFGVYGFLAAYIGQQFFVSSDPTTSLLSSFAVFALSFFVRPIGGFFFGPLSDRIGRRQTLVLVVTLMSGSTFLIGLLPTYASIGILAPALLVLLRCVQGLSAGGEIGTTTSFLAEYAGPGRRGYSTSWIMVTGVLGFVFGGLVANGMTFAFGAPYMSEFGWRIPFLIAGPLGAVALYIRLRLEDSPEFLELAREGKTSRAPLRDSMGYMKSLTIIFFAIALHNALFYLVLVYASIFMAKELKFTSGTTLSFVLIASLISVVILPLGGAFTDRYGRKLYLMITGAAATVSMFWFFYASANATPSSFIVALLVMAVCFALYASSTFALMSELLPTQVRSTGIAIAYNLPTAIFGGGTPFISTWLIQATGDVTAPKYFYLVIGILAVIALAQITSRDLEVKAGLPGAVAAE